MTPLETTSGITNSPFEMTTKTQARMINTGLFEEQEGDVKLNKLSDERSVMDKHVNFAKPSDETNRVATRSVKITASDAMIFVGGLIVIILLLVPYASNGFWFDDALNSQVYFFIQRIHGGLADLGEFSYHVTKHWLQHEGRLMLGFFYGYSGFYLFHDLFILRLAQCATVVINIALYGYVLWLLGVTIRFLVIWAILLVGLFQIHGAGFDPVAGFAFHYQVLGIQLSIALILFVKWIINKNLIYLYFALILWLFFMLSYETNAIFIPIAFLLMYTSGNQYRKFPGVLLICAACLYLALTLYLKINADGGSYAGSAFGLPSKMGLSYLKQLTATFPFTSYLAVTNNYLPFGTLIRDAIFSSLAWAVFIFSLIVFSVFSSIKISASALKGETFVISLGMFLLPAIFPAISLRYQNEVTWGVGTLPVYYQDFGLAFFAAWAISLIPWGGKFRFVVPILISIYLALNVTINSGMVKIIDMSWREPRDTFSGQAKSGLFSQVQDGDIIYVKNVANYINSNLIFQWSGKRVYVPTDDHYWHSEAPGKFAKTFELSRRATADRSYQLVEILTTQAEYQLMPPHENLVKGLNNFPANAPLAEIQIELPESTILKTVSVSAIDHLDNDIGNWTTQPVSHLWGIGIIDNAFRGQVINNGIRNEMLNLSVSRQITLLMPDNGNLFKCHKLHAEILLDGGKRISASADCKR